MNNGKRKLTLTIVTLFCCSLVCLCLFAACNFTYTFTINGRVTVNGKPVEGVKVSCELAETTTDENGEYVLSDLTGEVTINFRSEDYWFPVVAGKVWADSTIDMTDGKSYRTVSGRCVNGNAAVSGAQVTLAGANKTFVTFTDEEGNFNVPGLAGDVNVSAVADGQQLFGCTCPDESTAPITLQATADVDIPLLAEENLAVGTFTVKCGGQTLTVDASQSKVTLRQIKFGTVVEFVSDKYGFDNATFAVTDLSNAPRVTVYDKYDLGGSVVCGNASLGGVEIYVDGKAVATTDGEGKFVLSGLYGKHEIKVSQGGYVTEELTADKTSDSVSVDLQKRIGGAVKDDFGKPIAAATITVGGASVTTDDYGKYEILARNGQTLTASKGDYVFGAEKTLNADCFKVNFVGQTLYDVAVSVTGDSDGLGVVASGDKLTVVLAEDNDNIAPIVNGVANIVGLYGEKQIEFAAQNYRVSGTTKVNAKQTQAKLTVAKLYTISNAAVVTGNIPVASAEVLVNDNFAATTDEQGLFSVTVANGDKIKVNADGYDDFRTEFVYSGDGFTANLTYKLQISVVGGNGELRYTVRANDVEHTANGKIILTNLSGETNVELLKDRHSFDIDNTGKSSAVVTRGATLTATTTYTAEVSVMQNKAAAAGVTVVLIDNDTEVKTEKLTGEDGKAVFDNLTSVYTLIAKDINGVRFKPDSITVSEGGLYAFADVGYSVTIKTVVGDSPIADVALSYDGRTSHTSVGGEYKLNLFDATTVTIAKDGYLFDKAELALTEDDADKVIVVSATYSVGGIVTSGTTPIVGATVTIDGISATTDEQGRYSIDGIDTSETEVTVSANGFVTESMPIAGHCTADIALHADITFGFVSGNIQVDDVTAFVGGKETTRFALGDVVTFAKSGYLFDSVTVTASNIGTTVTVNATYSVGGTVTNAAKPIVGVAVTVDGKTVATTDSNGRFEANGLAGEVTLVFACDEYNIAPVTVSNPCQVKATATYDVVVKVLCGETPVVGVTIRIRNRIVGETNKSGVAAIKGLSGDNTLALSLGGYAFSGNNKVSGACELTFAATYSVAGSVKIGGDVTGVNRVNVSVGGNVIAQTDTNGNFTVSGLSGSNTLTFAKDGYEIADLAVNAPCSPVVNAKFFVVVRFDGDIEGATAETDGQKTPLTSSEMTFGPFDTETIIAFAKDGYMFSPSQIRATDYVVKNVNVGRAFGVSGRVTTSSGLPVVGMTMFASDKETTTDASGNYSFDGLVGNVQVSGKYQFNVNGTNLFAHDCSTGGSNVLNDNTQNVNFVIADTAYAWALYEANYNVRLSRYGNTAYKITGGADVTATMNVKTSGGFVKIKDANGNVLTESSNAGSSVMGVDPSVSLVHFAYGGQNKVTYAQVKGGDKVPAANKGNYGSATFSDVTDAQFADIYGASSQGVLIYKITENTTDSISVATEGNGFKLSLNLKTTAEMFAAYKKQIGEMSGVDMQSFEYVRLYITLDSKAYVTAVRIEEKYSVKTMGISATSTAVANHTYTYTNVPDLSSFKADNATIQKLLGR